MAVQTLEQLKALQLNGYTFKTVKTNGGTLTLRDKSNSTGGVITNIPNGTVVIAYKVSTVNGWDAVGVNVGGKQYLGFASTSYLVASTQGEIDSYLDKMKLSTPTATPTATAQAVSDNSVATKNTDELEAYNTTAKVAVDNNNLNSKSMLDKIKEFVQKPVVVAVGAAVITHLVDRFVVFREPKKKGLSGIGRKRKNDVLKLR